MQPCNQQGASDRFDRRLEELCWENRQLLVATSTQNTDREEAKAQASPSSYTLPMQIREKDHELKVVEIEDERMSEATAFMPGVELSDWPDMDPGGSIAMQRNTLLPSLISTLSYKPFTDIKNGDPLPQHMTSLREEFEDMARICGPSLQNGHPSVDARVNRSVISSLPLSIMHDDLSKVSDAMLNRISSRCMGSSSLQSLENTLLHQSTGDATMVPNAPLINPNLPGSSITNSRSISPSSDLDSVLLDSSGSGFSPSQGGKFGEVLGGKKARGVDDLDSDSEGSFDDVVPPRKPREDQGPSSKRMRAAETHNESERKRRGRINEKLKALQELIPNANKTDKASVLTEAIDYLKKLRLQLQVMCCRNGLVISPLLVSQGVQHLQTPHTGAGLNIDRDTGAALGGASATAVGLQSFPLTSNVASQGCSLPMELPAFNEAPIAPPTTFVSSSRTGAAYEPTTDLN